MAPRLARALDGSQRVQASNDEGCSTYESLVGPRHADDVVERVAHDAKRQPYAEVGHAKQDCGGLPAAATLRMLSELKHEWSRRGEHHRGHHHNPARDEWPNGTKAYAHVVHRARLCDR